MKIDKAYFDFVDIQKIFNVGECVARRIIREIRAFNGWSPLPKGKVLISEYENWVSNRGTSANAQQN